MRRLRKLILIGLIILVVFEVVLIINGLNELGYYNLVLLLIFLISYFFTERFENSSYYFMGLILIGVLNLLGGVVFIEGIRFYDFYFGIFKIDMLIHFLASFFGFFIIYDFLRNKFKRDSKLLLIFVCWLTTMGLGALFEIFELFGVVILGNSGVGDYLNNVLDLTFNSIGSFFAGLITFFKNS